MGGGILAYRFEVAMVRALMAVCLFTAGSLLMPGGDPFLRILSGLCHAVGGVLLWEAVNEMDS